jgi:type II secretory pathway pseudopilin PulG
MATILTLRDASPRACGSAGSTLTELMIMTGLIAVLHAIGIPFLLATLDESRAVAAARYMSTRLYRTRTEALSRSSNVGLRFVQTRDGYAYAVHTDGNGNGLRTQDIQRGIDREISPAERLRDHFSGVDFGVAPDIPSVEPGGNPPGGDPIRVGASNIVSFSALGTATPGSLYIRSPRGAQYALRILGETGRTRLLRFNVRTRRWLPL